MEAPPSIPAGGSASGSAFLYQPPGKAVSIYLEYDVVDRMNFDIMKGYGAVPKRGAEVGGILLGSVERGDRLVIKIEDYVAVACEHLRGPSYILSDSDRAGLSSVLEQWAPGPDKRIHAIGFFRSNTRDSIELGPEDRSLIDGLFKGQAALCLLVRPYATRIGEAVYFWPEDGVFPSTPSGEMFPFRRRELGGGPRAKRPPVPPPPGTAPAEAGGAEEHHGAAVSRLAGAIVDAAVPTFGGMAPPPAEPSAGPAQQPTRGEASPASVEPIESAARPGWVWIPLSFIFLLLGVVLGFQISMSFNKPPAAAPLVDPYDLGLTVARSGDSLLLKWKLDAPALGKAERGVLAITDGEARKMVDLAPEDLARGAVLYRNSGEGVGFRLEVFQSTGASVSGVAEIRLTGLDEPASPAPAAVSAEQQPVAPTNGKNGKSSRGGTKRPNR